MEVLPVSLNRWGTCGVGDGQHLYILLVELIMGKQG